MTWLGQMTDFTDVYATVSGKEFLITEEGYKSPAYRFLALVILLTVVLLLADFGLILPNCSTKTKLITHGLYLIGFYNAICAIREEKEREEE